MYSPNNGDSFDTVLRKTTDHVIVLTYTAFHFILFVYAIYLEYKDSSQTNYEDYEDMVG